MTAIFWTDDGQWEGWWRGMPAVFLFATRELALAWIHHCNNPESPNGL